MATRQRTRARNQTGQRQTEVVQTGIVSKTNMNINQAQSVELAKTFLHSSIGSITYLRDLFPVDCYGETQYNTEKGVIPYNEFARGIAQEDGSSNPSFGHTFRVIMRNKSAKVDAFLDTLEDGIFFALESGHLKAFDLLIIQHPQTPLHILEKYTYHFHHGAEGISAITPPGPDKTPISLETIKQDMRSVIKRIIELDRVLPRLPENRYLSMQLHYTENVPDDFESPGFIPASDTVLRIDNDRGWFMADTAFGDFKTNDHNISLVGSILENTNSELSVPANLEFVECPNIIPFPTVSKNSRPLALIEASKRDPIAKATKIRPIITPLDTTQDHDADESLPLPADEEFTRRQLQGMQLSIVSSKGQVDTQRITQETSQTSCKFVQRFQDRQPFRIAATIIKKLNAGGRHKPNGLTPSKHDGVSCLCGWNHDEESMVQCHFCGDWQHIFCLGYISCEDSSIPEVYACIKCLLDKGGLPAEEDMRSLALVRNGLQIVLSTGFTSDREFRAALHCDAQDAQMVIDILMSEEILNHNKEKSHRLKGRNYCVRRQMPKLERVLNDYFNPARGIKFLFEDSVDQNQVNPDSNTSYRATTSMMFASPIEDLDLDSVAAPAPGALRSAKRMLQDNDNNETRHAKRYRVSESLTLINVAMRST